MKKFEKKEWITLIIGAAIIIIIAVLWRSSAGPGPASQAAAVEPGAKHSEEVNKNNMDKIAKQGDHVFVNYTGTLTNGTKFDSSYDRGEPIDFVLGKGQVIKGWDEGIQGMKVGEKKHLVIPPEKAYGASGIPGAIPPNATLVFDVELVDIQ
jgi:FKBP-type peptidyl-prolyl cis-trans isomerase FkpA